MNRNIMNNFLGTKGNIICTALGNGNLKNFSKITSTQHYLGRLSSTAVLESRGKENVTSTSFSASSKEIWDLCVGLLVERKPIITSEKNAIEKKYMNFLNQYEIEMSKRSDHEKRREKDVIMQDKVKSGEIDQGSIQTAQDFEDVSTAELNEFVFQSRITDAVDADTKKDVKSLQRALDSHLFLLVHQKLGRDLKWLLPQTKRLEGETLRQVAERIVHEIYPDNSLKVLSNAPWGFYKYKYPRGVKMDDGRDITGAKVFFYKAQIPYDGVGVTAPLKQKSILNISDYMWLTHSEMKSKLTENYYKSVSDILIS